MARKQQLDSQGNHVDLRRQIMEDLKYGKKPPADAQPQLPTNLPVPSKKGGRRGSLPLKIIDHEIEKSITRQRDNKHDNLKWEEVTPNSSHHDNRPHAKMVGSIGFFSKKMVI